MATHSSTLAWRIPLTKEPGRLQSTGSKSQTRVKVRHFRFQNAHTKISEYTFKKWNTFFSFLYRKTWELRQCRKANPFGHIYGFWEFFPFFLVNKEIKAWDVEKMLYGIFFVWDYLPSNKSNIYFDKTLLNLFKHRKEKFPFLMLDLTRLSLNLVILYIYLPYKAESVLRFFTNFVFCLILSSHTVIRNVQHTFMTPLLFMLNSTRC